MASQGGRWTSAAMAVVLEEVPAAACVVDPEGRVALANAAGRNALERDPSWLDAARAGETSRFTVTPLASEHTLVVERAPAGLPARVDEVARRWSLSRRQTQVLAELAAGRANKAIAAELRIAESTVVVHVSTILRRAQCASRAELLVAVSRGGASACSARAVPRRPR